MIIIKKFKAIACLTALLLSGTVCRADSDVNVYINGMRFDGETIMNNDKTYIPLRDVSEALGAEVVWDEASSSAFITFTQEDVIAKVVENVSPSVVTIVGNYDSGSSASYSSPTMHGSGVIYKSSGYIITNAHVVKDIKNLTVVLNDGTVLPGNVLYSDEKSDLAIVKINKLGLKPITMASKSDVISGRTAIAMGTPISLSMRNTVNKGIICGTDVSIPDSYYKLLQTDASINPGNSGGPLLNTKGELIGINSSKYISMGIDNVAFAIPVDTVCYAIEQFEKYGYIRRPEHGITLEQSWEARIGLPTSKGITVKASKNPGLVQGDIITAVNGIEVHSITDWNEAIKSTYDSAGLKISYTRGGITGEVVLNV